MEPRPRVLGLLIVVAIAGCGGVIGPQKGGVGSVTPAEVPTVDTRSQESVTPVDTDGGPDTSNYSAVAAAHQAFLADRSFTVVASQSIRYPESGRKGTRHIVGRFDGTERFHVQIDRTGSASGFRSAEQVGYFSDGQRVVKRLGPNRTDQPPVIFDSDQVEDSPTAVLPINPRFGPELQRLFTRNRVTNTTRLPRAGQPYQRVRVTLRGPVDRYRPPSVLSTLTIRNITAQVVIDERGFVRRFAVEYGGSFSGQAVVIRWTVEYVAVGTTQVSRPSWVGTALNATAGTGSESSSATDGPR